ncbi:MAG TPA: TonB-dependent receptor [Bryobacteraceae bacterium]|nr:TonB-dependent receptor [Bryobacteraceae bacterium]
MTRGVLVLAVAATCCFGQDNKDEIIQKLISRVEALEREVAALKQAPATAPTPSTEQPLAVAAATDPPVAAAKLPAAAAADVPESTQSDTSRFTLRGYADAGFLRNVGGDSVKRFSLGEVDLFATARISPKLTALLETVLETDNQLHIGDVPINVERVILQYRHNDYFNLDIGSYRTAIGFYSTAYLRGSWFQTALSRPRLFDFEDDRGFLPLHNVGVSANGRIPSGALGLHYVVEVGSSRNYAQAERTGIDLEQNGAVNVAIFAQPSGVRGLQLGFSTYHDKFSPAPGVRFDRSVWTAHAVYHARRLELLNEGVLERGRNVTNAHISIAGFYAQAAYRIGSNWSPYVRFDYSNVYGKGDLVTGVQQYLPWRTISTGGIRYDLTESVAFKVELGRETDRFQPAWIRAAAQIAFTF